jgi:hypothetical protein
MSVGINFFRTNFLESQESHIDNRFSANSLCNLVGLYEIKKAFNISLKLYIFLLLVGRNY